MLAIMDYGAGNLTSVARALEHLAIPCAITSDPGTIAAASGIIFPGVGNAAQAMGRLRDSGLDLVLAEAVKRKQPLLGICVGCQILLEHSEEGNVDTLGIVQGDCIQFGVELPEAGLPVPHMGWNSLERKRDSILLAGIPETAEFYFVHSYYPRPAPEFIIATTSYGHEFCSVFGQDGLWATQFHPEKSGPAGLQVIANFYQYCNALKTGHSLS